MPSTKASNRVSKPRSKQSRSRNAEPVRKLRTLLPMPPREEERRAPGILSDNFSRSMVHPPVPVQGYNMTQHLVANQNFTYNQAAAWQPVIPAPMSASRTQMQASAQVGKLPPNVHVALVVMPFMLEEGKWHLPKIKDLEYALDGPSIDTLDLETVLSMQQISLESGLS
ncbi:hypothetical protein CFE70_009562 [Pyrenophora teres f. teres 0-1]